MLRHIFNRALPLLLGLACLLGLFLFGPNTADAANPATVNFQGKVVNSNGTNVADGTYSFVFRIYNTATPTPTTACSSDATCLYEETQASVTVTSGIFQVELGSTCSGGLVASNSCTKSVAGGLNFGSNNALYLTMQFNGDTSGSHGGFMWPLIHLTSVPYAYYADNAGTLGGLDKTGFIQNQTSSLQQANFRIQSSASGSVAAQISGASGQSVDIFDVLSNGNITPLLGVTKDGFITLQSAASLISGQAALAQTFTNGSSTGGTVNGYSQTITVNNTSSASTTNGIKISLTDNTALANTNVGLALSLNGSNSSQQQVGVDSSVNAGIGIRGLSSGIVGGSATCGPTGSLSVGVCGDSTATSSNSSVGVYGRSSSLSGSLGSVAGGSGVYGRNTSNTTAGTYSVGVKGVTTGTGTAGVSIGTFGQADGGAGATVYGGYFTLGTGGATAGAALYASNSTVAANILQLQNNGVNAMVVNSSGNVVLGQSSGGGANGTLVFDNSSGSGTATITLAGNPTTNYTYQLPTGTVGSNQCLQSGTVSGGNVPLTFASCSTGGGYATIDNSGTPLAAETTLNFTGNGVSCADNSGSSRTDCSISPTLKNTYDNGGSGGGSILLTSTGGGIVLQNATSDSLSTLFTIENNAATFNYLTATLASGVPHLKVFGASSTNYADIYYDASSSTAYFTASAGTTSVGTGSGPVNILPGAGAGVTITANAASNYTTTSGNLTFDAGGGTIVLGTSTTTLQKVASSFILDISNAGASTLNVSNSNGSNVANLSVSGDIAAGSGHVFKVGATSGSTISACGSNNYIISFASTGGLVTGGSCSTIASSNLSDASNIAFQNAANIFTATNTFQNSTDSANALQVKNQAGSNVFNIDNTKANANNKIANSSFESSISNWSAIGTASAPAQTTAQAYEQTHSLLIATTGAQGGAKYVGGGSMLASNTTYTLSGYVQTDSNLLVTTFEMGYMNDGSTPTSCLTGQTLSSNDAWQRFTCTFTTGTVTSGGAVYFRQTDSTTRNFYIDDVLLQFDDATSGRQSDTNYRNSALNLTGTIINGSVVLQNAVNSSTALNVENASGNTIFNVDTTDTNLVSNPGFEKDASGWTGASSATVVRSSLQAYLGSYSLKVTASGTANNGAQFSLNPVVTAQSIQYTISWFAKLDGTSTAMTDMAAIYSPEGTTLNACTPSSGTVATSGWIRYSCQVTDSTHAPTTSGFIRISQTGTTTGHIYYIDAVQLEAASSASAYGAGAVSLNGVITSPVVFKSANATTAFQIQNSSSLNLLGADSLNNLIVIGSSVSHASNPVVLVLDNYNNASDPTGGQATNGAMYYNASTNKFRCYQNGGWTNCGGVVNAVTLVAVRTSNTGAIANSETQVLGYTIPASSSAAGDTYRITAYYTRSGTNTTAPTFRIRIGSTSLSGNIAATLTGTAAGTANNGVIQGNVTIYTTGAGGTVGGGMWNLHNADTSPHVASTATVAVDTTANKIVELTAISGQASNSYTFTYVTIEKISNQ